MGLVLAFLIAAPTRWPIQSLTVEGNKLYTARQILGVAGLKVGQPAGKPEFEAARDRLVATGAFASVGYRFAPAPGGKGYAASFQVAEFESVHPFRFEELRVADGQLRAALAAREPLFTERVPPTEEVLSRFTAVLSELEKEKVIARLEEDQVVFRPARQAPRVAELRFTGNQVLPAEALAHALAPAAVGSPYREDRMRDMLNTAVRPLYEARGRLRVAFPKVASEPAAGVKGLRVTIAVEEGPSYELGDVSIQGAPASLLKAGKFKTGDVANFDEIKAGLERMRKALGREGYLKPEVEVERKIDDARKTVDLLVGVEPGPQFTFRSLSVKGLDIHGEAEIKRLWALKEGKPFNADYPEFFLRRVKEDGVFEKLEKTRSEVKLDETARAADVILYFNY